jgi:hypothetical protein
LIETTMSDTDKPKSPRLSDVTLPPPSHQPAVTMPPSPSPAGPASISGMTPGEEVIHAGKRINKYLIRRMLGRGGMGAVYEAMDIPLQRKVALKILPHEFSANEEALQRFIREAQLAARLQHPNAVAVFDVGKKGTLYYIAMELVLGPSGQQILETRKLDWRTATQAILDACRGMAAAHAAGLVHRDIKPGNLLFAPDGSVKVSDFGLAKPAKADNLSLTRQDAFVGTPLYMSPEQCRNDAIDHRTDIYSLGATYFTLLTGEAPYNQGSAIQILFAHCSAPIPDPAAKLPELPPLCAHIIRRAMSKHPQDRYQSAREMQTDLESLLGGAVDAPIGAGDGLGALAASVPAGSDTQREPSWVDYQSPQTKKKSKLGWYIGGGVAAALLLLLLGMFVSRPTTVAVSSPAGTTPIAPASVTGQPAPVKAPSPNGTPSGATPTGTPGATVVPTPPDPKQVLVMTPTVVPPDPKPEVKPEPKAEPKPEHKPDPAAVAPTPETPTEPKVEPAPEPKPEPKPEPVATPPEKSPPPPENPGERPRESDPPPIPDDGDPRMMPMREFAQVKAFAAEALRSKNKKDMEVAAQTLILWHDFFQNRPVPSRREADEAKQLADKLKPGISRTQPRTIPAPGGPPLPPQRDNRPDAGPGGQGPTGNGPGPNGPGGNGPGGQGPGGQGPGERPNRPRR